MKGLELSRKFYETYGAPMLHEKFPELEDKLAIGLVGDGSECFGYDDDISRDHDFEPGFCIFVPDDIDSRTEFQLERAYAKLPKSFEGVDRLKISPVGGSRHGVIKTGDFYLAKTGSRTGFDSVNRWMTTLDSCLAAATNGEVFRDDLGEFSRIRQSLLNMPQDVRLKKLAGHLIMAAQAGQYNYPRCVRRGDTVAAQLAIAEFTRAAMSMVYLLNRSYAPYYKWTHRGMKNLEKLPRVAVQLEKLSRGEGEAQEIIEGICLNVSAELRRQQLTTREDTFLIDLCADMMQRIQDPKLRQTHIMQE